ncbi:MAG: hypothetical protein HGA61_00285 [Candidatus Moranbacteria bacterium]|nr:hypothetical protein [Candidatus Moranbacteria bacterium]
MKNKKKKQKNINSFSIFLLVAFLSSCFFATGPGLTADNSIAQIEELNERAAVYRQIIDIKKKQSETLGNKISSMDLNIKEVKNQIEETENQIEGLNSQIQKLENQINEKKELIDSQKKTLIKVIQAYYQISQTSSVAIYLADENIASFMVNKDRISQTGDKISEMIEVVNELKAEIEKQSDELSKRKADVVDAHQDLQVKNDNFQAIRKKQTALLVQTQGEAAQYAQLLKRVEEQKAELLDIDQFFASSGLSADNYPKPDSKYFASTGWYFSQQDSRWGNLTIGKTKTLMKSYGCAVTSVAMVFKSHGTSITPGILAKQPIFSGDLINWPDVWEKPKLSINAEGKSHKNINWSTIDSEIVKGNPVIVYIGKSDKSGGHYVVVHHKDSKGKYVVHDPYFGANIFLDTSRALVGAMGSDSSTYIDQMIVYN